MVTMRRPKQPWPWMRLNVSIVILQLFLLLLGSLLLITTRVDDDGSYFFLGEEVAHRRRRGTATGSGTETSSRSVNELAALNFQEETLAHEPHLCGTYKCVFPLQIDPTVGYLASDRNDPLLESQIKAYDITIPAIEEADMDHIYLASPKRLNVSQELVQWLNENKTASYKRHHNNLPSFSFPRRRHKKKANSGGDENRSKQEFGQIDVQLVRIIPQSDAILFGCTDNKFNNAANSLSSWVQQLDPRQRIEVADQIATDFTKLHRLLETTPCLYNDFQVFLIKSTGRIVHLDVDRCFPMARDFQRGNVGEAMAIKCRPRIEEMEALIAKSFSTSQSEMA